MLAASENERATEIASFDNFEIQLADHDHIHNVHFQAFVELVKAKCHEHYIRIREDKLAKFFDKVDATFGQNCDELLQESLSKFDNITSSVPVIQTEDIAIIKLKRKQLEETILRDLSAMLRLQLSRLQTILLERFSGILAEMAPSMTFEKDLTEAIRRTDGAFDNVSNSLRKGRISTSKSCTHVAQVARKELQRSLRANANEALEFARLNGMIVQRRRFPPISIFTHYLSPNGFGMSDIKRGFGISDQDFEKPKILRSTADSRMDMFLPRNLLPEISHTARSMVQSPKKR